MKRAVLGTSVCALLLMGASAKAAVWQETQSWNAQWEARYSQWVETSFNEDFFTSGKYKGISTDCADAVYAARLIFAYENSLPFAIKDPTGGSQMITNKMTRFDGTGDSFARLKRFINYVSEITSTKSLPNDSYPIKISREHVKAGTIWSRPRITKQNIFSKIFGGSVKEDPGHAELVKEVSEGGAVYLIGSTVPAAVRPLITTSSLVFMPVEKNTGFRNWIQPQQYAQGVSSLPGYSLEQFEIGVTQSHNSNDDHNSSSNRQRHISQWTKDVQERLALRPEEKGESYERQAQNLCNLVTARIDVVQKSEVVRQRLNGTCMNADQYDAYSTPSRDKRILKTIKDMASSASGFGITSAQRIKKLKSFIDQCPAIEYRPGRKMDLYDFITAMLDGKVSSNPNDSLEARWGLADSNGKGCPKY